MKKLCLSAIMLFIAWVVLVEKVCFPMALVPNKKLIIIREG